MNKKQSKSKNITLLKLHGTPFKSAAELKKQEEIILREEWQNVERARTRRDLLMREENQSILAPLKNGLSAKYVVKHGEDSSLVKVFLTPKNEIQVHIDSELVGKDTAAATESLVKSLLAGLLNGYLSALGLSQEVNLASKVANKT